MTPAQANGIARYALARAARYATDRTVWSTPIGAHQGIAHPLAESHIAVELGRLATMRSAELFLTLAGRYSLIVVEHDMDFVAKIAQKVTVLHEGRVLAEGTMDDVQRNVRKADNPDGTRPS